MPADISGANIRIGATSDGAIAELQKLRSQFALFTKEMNSKVSSSFAAANKESGVFRKGLTQLGKDLTNIGAQMLLLGTLPTIFAGQQAYKDFAEVQRLERGLAQYGETLEKVRRIAKEPNIGVFDGAKALIGLRAARVESQLAERAVRSFANAITLGGGNSADLEPALFNLKQFKATQNINQVDLRQLANRVPQTMEVLEKAFGTLDPSKLNQIGIDKFIEGFISGLEKLPKASGGASAAMEQLADSFTFASAAIGGGIDLAFGVSDKISKLGNAFDNLAINFKALNPEAQKSIIQMTSLGVVIPLVVTAVGALIRIWPYLTFAAYPISGTIAVAAAIGIVGAAIGGLIALYPTLTSVTAEYRAQQTLLVQSAPEIKKLTAEYDELKKTVNDSPEGQRRLKEVIAQIVELVPTAAAGWDKYGNALDINKNKVKEFTGELKKTVGVLGENLRATYALENARDRLKIKKIEDDLQSGTQTKRVSFGRGESYEIPVEIDNKKAKELLELKKEAQARIDERQKEVLQIGKIGVQAEADRYNKLLALKKEYAKKEAEINRRQRTGTFSEQLQADGDLDRLQNSQLAKQLAAFEAQRKKTLPIVADWNDAVRADRIRKGLMPEGKKNLFKDPALGDMSVYQLDEKVKSLREEIEKLNPTAKNYNKTQATLIGQLREANALYEKRKSIIDEAQGKGSKSSRFIPEQTQIQKELFDLKLETLEAKKLKAIAAGTRLYKEQFGAVSQLKVKQQELLNPFGNWKETSLNLTAEGSKKRSASWLKSVMASRIPQSMDAINSKYDKYNLGGFTRARFETARNLYNDMPTKSSFGGMQDIMAGMKQGEDENLSDYETRLDIFARGAARLSKLMPKGEKFTDKSSVFSLLKMLPEEDLEDYERRVDKTVSLSDRMSSGISSALQNAATDAGVAFGELLGNLANGTGGLKAFATNIVGILGSMLKEMGKALIAAGTGGIALKVIGSNPFAAVAAGVGLVALGQITQNSMQKSANKSLRKFAKGGALYNEQAIIAGDNPNARFDPEIISPASSVKKIIHDGMKDLPGTGGGEYVVGELRMHGTDMVALIKKVNKSNVALGIS